LNDTQYYGHHLPARNPHLNHDWNLNLAPLAHVLKYLGYHLELMKWGRENRQLPRFDNRSQLYKHVSEKEISGMPIDYLEFGVWKGKSLRFWSEISLHPESRFWGFDTFTGLPEDWQNVFNTRKAGFFSVEGDLPQFEDKRVRLVQGLFQDTLPRFLDSSSLSHRIVVNCDADLYSSTLYILSSLDRFLKHGDIILFDEFKSAVHEYRAFLDYTIAFRRELIPMGTVGNDNRTVAFEIR
jgi:O-methyltransferase